MALKINPARSTSPEGSSSVQLGPPDGKRTNGSVDQRTRRTSSRSISRAEGFRARSHCPNALPCTKTTSDICTTCCGNRIHSTTTGCTQYRASVSASIFSLSSALAVFQASGPARLAELRDQGLDPNRTAEARRKVGEKNAQRLDEASDWDRRHLRPDSSEFKTEILPLLQTVSLKRLAAATNPSRAYCSRVRRGLHVPHPLHWDSLRSAAAGQPE